MTWHCKKIGFYGRMSDEVTDNAQEIASILINEFGWTLEAAAGALGNMYKESGLNPWIWQGSLQSDNSLTIAQARAEHGTSHGYGLIGWTPSGKYQFNNFATSGGIVYFPNYDQESYSGYGPYFRDVQGSILDGSAQVRLLATAMQRHSGNIWITRQGHSTIDEYIAIDTTPEFAAQEFWWGAEYSESSSSIPERQEYAREIYDWLVEHGWEPSGGNIFQIMMFIIALISSKWLFKL